jgi:hypothetical protein
MDIQAVYSSELTVNDQIYARTRCGSVNYYYEAIEINVIDTGYYILVSDSTIDTYGSIYENRFSVFNSRMRLLLQDDNSGCSSQFKMLTLLQVNITYILVVTTSFPNVTGTFSVLVFGSKNVSIHNSSEYLFLYG